MSYTIYKVLHLMGILFLFLSLGTAISLSAADSARAGMRKLASITHGVALLVILVAGFGLLARLGLTSGMPGWAYFKLAIWVLMAAALFAMRKWPRPPALWWVVLPLLGTLAAWLAVRKPMF